MGSIGQEQDYPQWGPDAPEGEDRTIQTKQNFQKNSKGWDNFSVLTSPQHLPPPPAFSVTR